MERRPRSNVQLLKDGAVFDCLMYRAQLTCQFISSPKRRNHSIQHIAHKPKCTWGGARPQLWGPTNSGRIKTLLDNCEERNRQYQLSTRALENDTLEVLAASVYDLLPLLPFMPRWLAKETRFV